MPISFHATTCRELSYRNNLYAYKNHNHCKMGNKEGNLYCQAIFLNFEGGMGTGWFRVKDEKKQ